jgi:hypothetical protein
MDLLNDDGREIDLPEHPDGSLNIAAMPPTDLLLLLQRLDASDR